MTLEEIKAAVEAGKTVHCGNDGYVVIKDDLGHWLIAFDRGGPSENYIGLTWRDGKTMNAKPERFYVGDRPDGGLPVSPFCSKPLLQRLRESAASWQNEANNAGRTNQVEDLLTEAANVIEYLTKHGKPGGQP